MNKIKDGDLFFVAVVCVRLCAAAAKMLFKKIGFATESGAPAGKERALHLRSGLTALIGSARQKDASL